MGIRGSRDQDLYWDVVSCGDARVGSEGFGGEVGYVAPGVTGKRVE